MNIDDYMMMLQMQNQGQGGGATSQGIPNLPHMKNVPRGTENPINQGSTDAIHKARESLSQRPSGFLGQAFNLLGDIGTAGLRGSRTPMARELGRGMLMSEEEQAQKLAQNMQIMNHMQRQEEARQMAQHRMNQEMAQALQLQEMQRHHKAHEGFQHESMREKMMEKHALLNEAKVNEKRIHDESGEKVRYIEAMPTSVQNKAIQRGREYQVQNENSGKSIEVGNRILDIARSNPDILNNWKYVTAHRYTQDPGYLNQALMNLGLSDEEKANLLELESLIKEYNLSTLKSFPANTRANQFLEQTLFSANPSGRMPLSTLENVIGKQNEINFHQYNETAKGADYFNRGYIYETKPRSISQQNIDKAKSGIKHSSKEEGLSVKADELGDIDKRIKELEEFISSHEKKESE